MNTLPGSLTAAQLRAYEVLQRVRMAWVALWFALGLFTIGFLSFLVAIFCLKEQGIEKGILGGIDTLLGFALRTVYTHLFPRRDGNS